MAYVCDADQIVLDQPVAPRHAGLFETLASLPRRALDRIVAWNEGADEAAAARDIYGGAAGKLTDAMEREMMRRLMPRSWSALD